MNLTEISQYRTSALCSIETPPPIGRLPVIDPLDAQNGELRKAAARRHRGDAQRKLREAEKKNCHSKTAAAIPSASADILC